MTSIEDRYDGVITDAIFTTLGKGSLVVSRGDKKKYVVEDIIDVFMGDNNVEKVVNLKCLVGESEMHIGLRAFYKQFLPLKSFMDDSELKEGEELFIIHYVNPFRIKEGILEYTIIKAKDEDDALRRVGFANAQHVHVFITKLKLNKTFVLKMW